MFVQERSSESDMLAANAPGPSSRAKLKRGLGFRV